MAGNAGKTILILVVVGTLLSVVMIIGVAVAMILYTSTEEGSDGSMPQAVSAEIEPEAVAPGAGLEPTFEPHEQEEVDEYEHDHAPDELSPERYREMTTVELVAWLSHYRLTHADEYEIRTELEKPFSIRSPALDEKPNFAITQGVYSGVGAVTYLVNAALSPIYTQIEAPNLCQSGRGGDNWDYFNERCKRFVYDELTRIRYDRPLYRDMAELDGETLALILKDLEGIEADTPMLGAQARQVYAAVAPAVHDYVLVWEAMGKNRKGMLAQYKKSLEKRGVLSTGNATRDMIGVYYDMYEEMKVIEEMHDTSYTHTILGFWLRRMHDGTAEKLVTFMKKTDAKFGK